MRFLILFILSTAGLSATAITSAQSCRIFLTVTFRGDGGSPSLVPVENFKAKVAMASRSEVVDSHFNQVVVATEDVTEVIALSEGFALEKVEHMGRTVPHYSSPVTPQELPHLQQERILSPREALFQALYLLPEGFYKLTDSVGGTFQLEFYFDKHGGQGPALHARLSSGFFLLPQSDEAMDRRTLVDYSTQPGLDNGKALVLQGNSISFLDPLHDPNGAGALRFLYDNMGVLAAVQAGSLQFEVQAFYPYSRATQGFKLTPSPQK